MKIPVCAGLHYARPFPPNHSVLRDTTPNVGKRVKMTPLPLSSPPFYAFSFFLFYDVPRLESRDSIFLRCLYIYNVCVCVCVWVCARGLVCIQGRGNRGLVSLKESRYNKTYRRTKYFSFFFRPLLRVGILRYFGVLK